MAEPESLAVTLAGTIGGASTVNLLWVLRLLVKRFRVEPPETGEYKIQLLESGAVIDVALPKSGPQTLEERLARIGELTAESSRLSDQVSAELEARAATAKKLQQEAEEAARVASINREQAEAVRKLLEADIANQLADSGKAIERNVRRDAIRIGAASFVAGGGLTLLITLLVHPLA